MGLLVNPDGSFTPSCIFFMIGIPFVAIGNFQHQKNLETMSSPSDYDLFNKPIQLIFGICLIILGFLIPILSSVVKHQHDPFLNGGSSAKGEDNQYKMLRADAIVEELKRLESQKIKTKADPADEKVAKSISAMSDSASLSMALSCIDALGTKYGNDQTRRKKKGKDKSKKKKEKPQSDERQQKDQKDDDDDDGTTNDGLFTYKPHELETLCQEAAYITLKLHPSNDRAVSASIALLAVVADDTEVRRRHYECADRFGLDLPIRAMRDALSRSKILIHPPPEEKERFCAELQRKACLWIGALADEDKDIATKMVDEEALYAILDATEWYRRHEEVANWALWAVFILCYDHMGNKQQLIQMNGIRRICNVMNNVSNSVEVARHGIGTLFDLLRQVPGSVNDVSQIRMIALNAGIHDVVKNAMVNFGDSMEITMMGQQMLVATGYKGEIPQYNPSKGQ